LLLLAAVQSSGLNAALLAALPRALLGRWLGRALSTTLNALLLTLLFLTAVGLHRPWDLRAYSGDALGLLTGRPRAYGYRIVERFLTTLAHTGAAERFTAALAHWTATLWLLTPSSTNTDPSIVYIDGHRKPLYSNQLIPRGLIGRTGKILGCRALTLLHDAAGHVLLATTNRGDEHLTSGAPAILAVYEQANPDLRLASSVVDREGMSGHWLAGMVAADRTVITLLRRDQYKGIESFSDVGDFVPLVHDADGAVIREVAPARFALPVPEHPNEPLPLSVALIRDYRWREVVPPAADELPRDWAGDLDWVERNWWEPGWQAPPAPAAPTQPRLIPIVSTAATRDALGLVEIYTRRWPAQENVIRDWLLPLGLDTNHGYQKKQIENSEHSKAQQELAGRLERLERWAERARGQCRRWNKQDRCRYDEYKARHQQLSRKLVEQQFELERQEVEWWQIKRTLRERKDEIEAELEQYKQRWWQAREAAEKEDKKLQRYCGQQRQVKRELEELAKRERQMYEVENNKDQIMTVCKVAMVNVGMYVRERWFPSSYAHCGWKRLSGFFALKGRVRWEREEVVVELRPFNDRALNRDLATLCSLVAEREARLPGGRRLVVRIDSERRLVLDAF
jgi:hypothetical protein